jgi:hypothetical protein
MSDLVLDAKLSQAAYSSYNQSNTPVIDGWRPIKLEDAFFRPSQADQQFGAQLYEKDGLYKVVYRGTQPNAADWANNPAIGGIWQQEMTDTIRFAGGALRYVMEREGKSLDEARDSLQTTGHSQGGFQSELAAKFYGLSGTSLDGPGMAQFILHPNFSNSLRVEQRSAGLEDLQNAYLIGNFDVRIYTAVGRLMVHEPGTNVSYSLSAKLAIASWLGGPAVGGPVTAIGLAAHLLDHIIATEKLRATSPTFRLIGENSQNDPFSTPQGLAQSITSDITGVLAAGPAAPDPATVDFVNTSLLTFLQSKAGQQISIQKTGDSAFVEAADGSTLLVKSNGDALISSINGNATLTESYQNRKLVFKNASIETIDPVDLSRAIQSDTYTFDPTSGETLSRQFSSTTSNSVGQPFNNLVVVYEMDGVTIRSTSLTERLPNNNTLTTNRDRLGNTTSEVETQSFDDGSSLANTTFPSGRTEVLATDSTGAPFSRTDTIPGSGTTETVNTYTYDAQGRPVQQSARTIQRFDDGTRLEEVTTFTNGQATTVRNTYGDNNELLSSQPVVRSTAIPALTGEQTTTALNDIAGLIGAIQGGQPLPILNSGLRVANSFAANQPIPSLVTAGQIVGGLSSLYNLSNALQNGDTLTQINATLSTLNYVNSTLPSLLAGQATTPLSAGLDTFLNGTSGAITNGAGQGVAAPGLINGGTPGVLPVLGLILAIRSGDPIGITSGIIGILNPSLLTTGPLGWILAGLSILRALLDEPPEAWGVAKFVFDGNGQLQIDAQGEAFGIDRVRGQLQTTRLLLNNMIAFAQISAPSTPLGIIPQRTASITWREERQDDKGYAINDIDPISGEQRYPFLRWDDNGLPFSSNPAVWQPDPTDPNIRVAMEQQLLESALRREAIAPIWEDNTAKIQQDSGDELAGLMEAERAARMGLGISYEANTAKIIALCAMNASAKRLNHAEIISEADRLYAEGVTRWLIKEAENDRYWRIAA